MCSLYIVELYDHENRLDEQEKKIDFFVRTSLPPVEGIFYDGQIFDAYIFVTDLKKNIHDRFLIVDDDKLFAFSKMNLSPSLLII